MENILKKMDFNFFSTGNHKISFEKLISTESSVFLDVRSNIEIETLSFEFKHFKNLTVLHIPVNEIPERLKEIPKDKTIGIFCSGGTRATIVYAYLRLKGYEKSYILVNGFNDVMGTMSPGKLYKSLK